MDQQPAPGSPGIAIMFLVLGFLFAVGGTVAFIMSTIDNDSTSASIGIGVAISSLFMFAASAIITRLHKIEHYLRPRDSDPPKAA
jgi:hypothetical protein